MSTFKQTVMKILEENENKKVSSIIELINNLQEDQKSERQKTYIMDSNNNVFAVFCYYHKQWEIVSETEYGKKQSSKTALNTMCKLGTNLWTKQQKDAKDERSELLDQLISQSISTDDAETMKTEIETKRLSITLDNSKGYTLEEVMNLLK